MEDPYRLRRFVAAQDADDGYRDVVEELRNGRKSGHWMWYVFPQLKGLGRSWMATEYAIASLAEARAYLAHPLLGPRLLECARLLLEIDTTRVVGDVFGAVDAMKLRSSMTLFDRADPEQGVFRQVLDRYFEGRPDPETVRQLGGE